MFDIICKTSMINDLSLYTGVTGNRMKLVEFREAVIQGLLRNKTTTHVPTQKINEHLLEKTSTTGRCKQCYEIISKEKGNTFFNISFSMN